MESTPATAKALFLAALALPIPERSIFLRDACAEPALRRRVEALLAAHDRAATEQGDPPIAPGQTIVYSASADPALLFDAGATIGPYTLREQIGEGGMGLVFVAEQAAPVRRKVALKLIKPGMDSRQVIARFEAERQALALMDHENIARVFDAGTTDRGSPYFVMELVKGEPLTAYCDAQRLTVRVRLELLLQVCAAVQHAHQKGIIHRDLKPSNVLVAVHDVTPVVKVIDFGIAKAVGQQLTDKTVYTAFSQLIGTPLYMSPEQAGQSSLDVDTRTDVYALGVMLYELLTGTTPFDADTLHRGGFDEMRRIIREVEPVRPSARISTLRNAADTTVADRRQADVRRLAKQVRGELDWVVMKCLEKDRNRRYESVNALAADLRRFLNNEPVAACPPTVGYRLRKFATRNRRVVVTAAMVAVALVAGAGVSVWQAIEATAARKAADDRAAGEAAARADAEANFLVAVEAVDHMLTRVGDEGLRDIPQLEPVRRQLIEDALAFHRRFQAARPDDPVRRHEMARALHRLGWLAAEIGRSDEAGAAFKEGNALLESLHRDDPGNDLYRYDLSTGYVAACWQKPGTVDEKFGWYTRAADLLRPLVDGRPADYVLRGRHVRGEMANALRSRSLILIDRDRFDEAEQDLATAIKLTVGVGGWSESILGGSYAYRAVLHAKRQQPTEAIAVLEKAIRVHEGVAKADPQATHWWSVGESWVFYGHLLLAANRVREAEDAFRRAAEVMDPVVADFPSTERYRTTANGGRWQWHLLLRRRGATAEAVRALDGLRPADGDLWTDRAKAYLELSQPRKAAPDLAAAVVFIRRQEQEKGKTDPTPGQKLVTLAEIGAKLGHTLLDLKHHVEAETVLREAMTIREEYVPNKWPHFNAMSMLGGALLGQGRHAEAEPLLLAGYDGLKSREEELSAVARNRLRDAAERLVELYVATDRPALAREWQAKMPRETAPRPRVGK